MKKNQLLFPAFLLAFCLTAKAQDTTTYTIKKYHYSISTPRSWSENKLDEKGNKSFVGVSPAESSDDSFLENVTVQTAPYIDQSLKSYFKDRVNRIKFSVNNYKHAVDGDEVINGEKSKFEIYTFDYDSSRSIKMIMYVFVKNKMAYIVSGMALESTFDAYKDKFQEIARSIRIEDIQKK